LQHNIAPSTQDEWQRGVVTAPDGVPLARESAGVA